MHISDGVLSGEVTVAATVATVGLLVYSFKNLSNKNIHLVSAYSALFFIASFIHIPFGFTQIHLMLIGFIGVFLGASAMVSIAIALILQVFLLGYGGVLSLSANILTMALPAYLVYLLFKLDLIRSIGEKLKFFLVGFLGMFFSTIVLFVLLFLSKDEYKNAAYSVIVINIPTMILEGLVTYFLFLYVKKMLPDLFKGANI